MKGFEIPKEIKGKINNEVALKAKFMDEIKASGDVKKALAEVFKTITEETRFNIGVIGEPKAGKSSLVNALAGLSGESAAKTGREIETTKAPEEYDVGEITFVDFPAFESWSCKSEEFLKKFDFRGYDLILNAINTKGDDPLQKVYENISSKNINYIIVRSNSDEILGSPKEVEEDRKDIIQDIKDTMGYKEEIYFVCCNPRCPMYREGINDLNKKITDFAQQGLKEIKIQRIKIMLDILKVEYLATLSQENKAQGLEKWECIVNELLQQYGFTKQELENVIKNIELRMETKRREREKEEKIKKIKNVSKVTGDISKQEDMKGKEIESGWISWFVQKIKNFIEMIANHICKIYSKIIESSDVCCSKSISSCESYQTTRKNMLSSHESEVVRNMVPMKPELQREREFKQRDLTRSDIE